MDQGNGVEVLSRLAVAPEASPKSAWEVAQEKGGEKVDKSLDRIKSFFKRAESVGKGLLGLATSGEARNQLGQEVKGAVVTAVENAAVEVYTKVHTVETAVQVEWDSAKKGLEAAWNKTKQEATNKASQLAERGVKAAAKFGVELVQPVVEGVVNAQGRIEGVVFNAAAGVLENVGRPVRAAGAGAERALRTPRDVVEGAMDGWKNKQFASGFADRLRGAADFLNKCRGRASEVYEVGSGLRRAAGEIRSGLASREKSRAQFVANVSASADQVRAGNL